MDHNWANPTRFISDRSSVKPKGRNNSWKLKAANAYSLKNLVYPQFKTVFMSARYGI